MISSIRDYIKLRIRCVNPDYQEIDDPIGDDDLATPRLDKKYKIIFGNLSGVTVGSSFSDDIPVTIEVYSKSDRRVIASYDSLYEIAIHVRNAIIEPIEAKNQEFTDVISSSIAIEALNTNDKTFKAIIGLSFRRDFNF